MVYDQRIVMMCCFSLMLVLSSCSGKRDPGLVSGEMRATKVPGFLVDYDTYWITKKFVKGSDPHYGLIGALDNGCVASKRALPVEYETVLVLAPACVLVRKPGATDYQLLKFRKRSVAPTIVQEFILSDLPLIDAGIPISDDWVLMTSQKAGQTFLLNLKDGTIDKRQVIKKIAVQVKAPKLELVQVLCSDGSCLLFDKEYQTFSDLNKPLPRFLRIRMVNEWNMPLAAVTWKEFKTQFITRNESGYWGPVEKMPFSGIMFEPRSTGTPKGASKATKMFTIKYVKEKEIHPRRFDSSIHLAMWNASMRPLLWWPASKENPYFPQCPQAGENLVYESLHMEFEAWEGFDFGSETKLGSNNYFPMMAFKRAVQTTAGKRYELVSTALSQDPEYNTGPIYTSVKKDAALGPGEFLFGPTLNNKHRRDHHFERHRAAFMLAGIVPVDQWPLRLLCQRPDGRFDSYFKLAYGPFVKVADGLTSRAAVIEAHEQRTQIFLSKQKKEWQIQFTEANRIYTQYVTRGQKGRVPDGVVKELYFLPRDVVGPMMIYPYSMEGRHHRDLARRFASALWNDDPDSRAWFDDQYEKAVEKLRKEAELKRQEEAARILAAEQAARRAEREKKLAADIQQRRAAIARAQADFQQWSEKRNQQMSRSDALRAAQDKRNQQMMRDVQYRSDLKAYREGRKKLHEIKGP